MNRLLHGLHALYRACLADDWPDMVKLLNADICMRRGVVGE
ncbi:hypothetical protein [Streptomyces sp. CBMA123]|nr:hypothetical protein [Streptomyces sp. CBMA123]